jgi:hypothetical protein
MDEHLEPGHKDKYSPGSWNNVMYSNITFWESLRSYGDTVLTIQADTLICSTKSPPWQANYLGGISDHSTPPVNESQMNSQHLNGGLSIRNLDWTISCLKNYTGKPTVEDTLFNRGCSDGAKSVSRKDAWAFSSDNGWTMCFDWQGERVCPWGVHKPWTTFGQPMGSNSYEELVRYCPDIELLRKEQGEIE